jgi:hypothetical protein
MSRNYPVSLNQQIRDGKVNGPYRIELRGQSISVLAVTTAIGFGSCVIGDFPNKRLYIRGIKASLGFVKQDANIIATWSGAWSLGSTPTADLTLAGTDVDIIPSTSVGPAVAGRIVAPAVGSEVLVTTEITRTWTAAEELNLNLIVNAADITDSTTGVVKVFGYIDFLLAQS